MTIAHQCGVRLPDFWAATPWQLRTVARAHGKRLEADFSVGVSLQWHGANLTRAKVMPDLQKYLAKPKRKGAGSVAAAVRALFPKKE